MSTPQSPYLSFKGKVCVDCRSAMHSAYLESSPVLLCDDLASLPYSGQSKACDLCRLIYQYVVYQTPSLDTGQPTVCLSWLQFDEESPAQLLARTEDEVVFLSSEFPREWAVAETIQSRCKAPRPVDKPGS